jgi:hypothetical protein
VGLLFDRVLSAKYARSVTDSAITEASEISELARRLGSRGGRARSEKLSAAEKRRIAALGGQARMLSLRVSRRIVENLRYAAAAEELRGKRRGVLREKSFTGRLPGIYPARS